MLGSKARVTSHEQVITNHHQGQNGPLRTEQAEYNVSEHGTRKYRWLDLLVSSL
jgi:hypothetical protein